MKLILLFSIACSLCAGFMPQKTTIVPVRHLPADSAVHYKITAFPILQSKCNVCHTERNRNAVFTFDNMNAWSGQINEQVFVKRRMPKGNTIVLSTAEKETLKKWINSIQ